MPGLGQVYYREPAEAERNTSGRIEPKARAVRPPVDKLVAHRCNKLRCGPRIIEASRIEQPNEPAHQTALHLLHR